MAFKIQFFFLGICIIVGFLHTAFGSSCNYDSDCSGSEGGYCCEGECGFLSCSETTKCVLNSDCPGAKYCCSSGDCLDSLDNCPLLSTEGVSSSTWCFNSGNCPGTKYCCSSGDCRDNLSDCPLSSASIAGIVILVVILVIIITSIVVSCLCCVSCPLYHSRLRGRFIVARPPYQNLQTATVITSASTCYQPPAQTVAPPPQTIAPPPYPGHSLSAYPGNQPSGDPQFSNTNTQNTGV